MIYSKGVFWAATGVGAATVVVASSILWRDFPSAWPGAAPAPSASAAAPAASAPLSEAGPAGSSKPAAVAPAPSQTRADPSAESAPPARSSAEGAPQRPSFDVVSVEPTGDTVVAGRAAPKASVELRADGKVIAMANADEAGQFAMVPPPLPPGGHNLQLASRLGEAPAVLSDAVPVEVPAPTNQTPPAPATAPATASASTPIKSAAAKPSPATPTNAQPPPLTAPTTDGQKVAAINPAPTGQAGAPLVWVEAVAATEAGRLEAKGRADPNALVRLYLNGAYLADLTAGADGRWSLTVERGMAPGAYTIRADVIDRAGGAVVARAEVRFTYPQNPSPGAVLAAAPANPRPTPSPAPAQAQAPVSGAPAQKPVAEPSSQAAKVEPPTAATAETAKPKAPAASSAQAAASASPAPAAEQSTASSGAAGTTAATPTPAEKGTPVVASTETTKPAEPSSSNAIVKDVRTAKVVRGDSLWAISRRFYGHGVRYGAIFEANASQIRDPKLIYPGQIFVVPQQTATP
jgi:nucleoid-associated protein YgaU